MKRDYEEPFAYEETIRRDSAPESKSHDIEIENNDNGTTKKVKIDLEFDTSTKDIGVNPYAKWVHLARTIDAWRPFPRLFIILYMYMVYRVIEWYLLLPDPTMEQSGLISIVVGAGAAWFGLYVGSGGRSPKE